MHSIPELSSSDPEFHVTDIVLRRGYGHMLHGYYVDRLRRIRRRRAARLAGLDSERAAQAYVEDVRTRIRDCFGAWPERTPLHARVTGEIRRPGYRIDKVIFESRPGCPVTSNLYVPDPLAGPAPGVVFSCGHVSAGKASPVYQACCQRLVRAGFVVLAYDPISQGERDQYPGLPPDARVRRNCCLAHNMMGKQMLLNGDFIGRWMAWDGIRALDYLCSRPEVDASRLGATGNSGGGTLSGYLWALDDRLTMAAVSCWIASYLSNLEGELPTDAEQCPPGVLAQGLDHADFILAAAPKPALLIGQQLDWFDPREVQGAYREATSVYRLLGREDEVECFVGAYDHGYHPDAQAAMVSFFCRHAGLPESDGVAEVVDEPVEILQCAPGGQALNGRAISVPALVAKEAQAHARRRAAQPPGRLRRALAALLGIRIPRGKPPRYVNLFLPQEVEGGYHVRCAVETEPGIRVLLHRISTDRARTVLEVGPEVHLLVPHIGAEADMRTDRITRERAGEGAFVVDLRGLGESMPDEPDDFFFGYGMDYAMHSCALMLGESLAGRRVLDLLRVIGLLRAEGAREIHLHGRGQGGLIALLAAALRGAGLASLRIRQVPETLLSLTGEMETAWPAANFIRGLLQVCDIPDLLKLAPGGQESR